MLLKEAWMWRIKTLEEKVRQDPSDQGNCHWFSNKTKMNKDKYLEADTILANTTFWGRVQKYNSSDIEKKSF